MTITTKHFIWTDPLNLALIALAIVLLVLQCALLYSRHRHSGRLGIRLVLNLLLWVGVAAWIVDPAISTGKRISRGLLVADNVPLEVAARLKDSLKVGEAIEESDLADTEADTLIIAGQDFGPGLFAAVRQNARMPHLKWVPYFENGQMQDLHWKGVVRKGEMQRIEGVLQVAKAQMLTVRFGDQALDSTRLMPGRNRFRLAFPAFNEGRAVVALHLNTRTADTLRYFSLPPEKLTIRFLLESPDFETRSLAAWLGKEGHSVLYDAVLSKSIDSRVNINRAKEPDLIVTTPGNAAHAVVRKAVANGKSVLFLGLGDGMSDVKAINNALGVHFQATRISNEESVNIAPTLTALPFRWNAQDFQSQAPHYPVLVERIAGRVAVSLLNETFPMQLSGDSLGYSKIWNEVFAWARPASAPVIMCDAPVWQNVPAHLHWNRFKSLPQYFTIGKDTVATDPSALNEESASMTFTPREAGWLALRDSLRTELFVESSMLSEAAQMQHFIQTSQPTGTPEPGAGVPLHRQWPAWGWFATIMLLMTALWIERKL